VLVPVIVRAALPPGVFAAVVTVKVELPEPLIVAGEKEAVAPAGKPETARLTWLVKPYSAPTFTV
jgi:hypothetical protein